jgi:PKD domain
VTFGGGPVMHSERMHVIFWTPSGSGLQFDPGYVDQVDAFLTRVAAASRSTGNEFGLMGQYGDTGGPAAYDATFAGPIQDTNPLPTDAGSTCSEPPPPPLGGGPGWSACVDDTAIQTEIGRVVRANALPTGLKDIYLLLTPNGLGSCAGTGVDGNPACALGGDPDGYCGYHSNTGFPGILYAVIPYNAVKGHCQSDNPRPNGSTADPAISTIAHELAETVTEPIGGAWSAGNGDEIGDLCISSFGPALGGSQNGRYNEVIDGGHYWIQELWSNFSHHCEPAANPDQVTFSVPRRPGGDRALMLTAQASDPQGKVVSYAWTFGDGHSGGHRQQVTHAFFAAGTFTVSLRIADNWGNWTFAVRRIAVRFPPHPVVTLTAAHVAATRATVRFGSDAAVATFQCRLDRGRWVACRSPFAARRLGAGEHTIYVRARDTFGQLSRRPARYAFTAT